MRQKCGAHPACIHNVPITTPQRDRGWGGVHSSPAAPKPGPPTTASAISEMKYAVIMCDHGAEPPTRTRTFRFVPPGPNTGGPFTTRTRTSPFASFRRVLTQVDHLPAIAPSYICTSSIYAHKHASVSTVSFASDREAPCPMSLATRFAYQEEQQCARPSICIAAPR
jgi:hypothetical protein